jgi:hypothetical protein
MRRGALSIKNPLAGHTPPEGVSAHAPPGNILTRRAYEQGGVSIAVLLLQGLLPYGSSDQEALGLHTYCSSGIEVLQPIFVKRRNMCLSYAAAVVVTNSSRIAVTAWAESRT